MQDVDDDFQVRVGKYERDAPGAVLEFRRQRAGRTAARHCASGLVPSVESLGLGTAESPSASLRNFAARRPNSMAERRRN